MTVVDASVMVSAFLPNDVHHRVCRTWLNQQIDAERTIFAPYLLLSEMAGSIARVTGNPQLGHAAIAAVLDIPIFTFIPYLDDPPTLAAILAADLQLKEADATYVAIASQMETDLVSMDREQLERGGRYVRT